MATSIRHGKLSLKRRRVTDHADAEVLATCEIGGCRTGQDGTTDNVTRFPAAGSGPESLGRSAIVASPPGRQDAAAGQPHTSEDRPVILDRAKDAPSQPAKLQALPSWYGLKENRREETPAKQEAIMVGNVAIEWRPLPAYCRQCLVRRPHKRAADIPERPSASIRSSDVPKSEDLHGLAQSSRAQTLQDGRPSSIARGCTQDAPVPEEESGDSSEKKVNLVGERSSKIKHQSSASQKGLFDLPTPSSQTQKKAPTQTGLPSKNGPSQVEFPRTSNLPKPKAESARTFSPPVAGNRDNTQKGVIEDVDSEKEILKRKSGPVVSSQMKNSSTPKLCSSSRAKPNLSGIPPGVTDTSFEGTVDSKKYGLKHQQQRASVKKGPQPSAIIPRNEEKVSSENHTQSSRRNSPETNPDQSKYPNGASRMPCPATSSWMTTSRGTSPSRQLKGLQGSHPSSPEIIIIDSDEEETCRTVPAVSSSSHPAGSKRKLSGTSSDREKKPAKKPKVVDSVAGGSGSPAAELTAECSSHSLADYSRCNFKQSLGGGRTTQTKLDGTLLRTAKPNRMTLSSRQAASMRQPLRATPGDPHLPKPAPSIDETWRQSASSKNTPWNLSLNAKPLFKNQTSGKTDGELMKSSQQVVPRVLADMSKSSLSNGLTPSQKGLTQGRTTTDIRSTGQPIFKAEDAPRSTKPLGKSPIFGSPGPGIPPGQSSISRQPKNQSAFRPGRLKDEPRRLPNEPSTSSQQRAGSSSVSSFQSAWEIRTKQQEAHGRNETRTDSVREQRDKWTCQAVSPNRDHRANSVKDVYPKRGDETPRSVIHPNQGVRSTHINTGLGIHKGTDWDSKTSPAGSQHVYLKQNPQSNPSTQEADSIQSCPLCLLQFHQSWTAFQRDGHIAKCLSESSDDVNW